MKEPLLFLLLWVGLSGVTATIPPHPRSDLAKSETWVPAQQYRRQLGKSLEKEPKVLNPELCIHEDEETCHQMDRSLQSQAHRTLELIQSRGNLKVLVILMQFSNHENRSVPEAEDISTLFNSEGRDADIVPTGSIKSYLRMNSHDSLDVDAFVVPWRTVDFTEQDCLFGHSGLAKDFQKCFWPVLDLLDRLHVDPSHPFDWVDYDVNGDGFIDSVVVMHSGYGAEWGGTDPDGNTFENRIWSHSTGPQEERWQSPSFLVDLGSYSVTSAFRSYTGNRIARIGLTLHEMIHTLGIPDLFDMSRQDQEGGVGSYSIMSDPWGQGDDSTLPGHLDPWSKYQLGWIDPKPITASGSFSMKPSEIASDVFVIDNPYPDGEYLLIEHRQQLRFDENLWTKGALIWHIDDRVLYNTEAGGPFQGDEWPENGKHYQVALVQADGEFELEQALNKGHAADFFTESSVLAPGSGGTVYPNTDSYQEGIILETGITISDFSIDGFNLYFRVSGLSGVPLATQATQNEVTEAPVPAPDMSECLVNINVGLCELHMETISPDNDCDCWNFCGNGMEQRCCKFGEVCDVHCHSGGLIAGCQITDSTGIATADFITTGIEGDGYNPTVPREEILFAGDEETLPDDPISRIGAGGGDKRNVVLDSAAVKPAPLLIGGILVLLLSII